MKVYSRRRARGAYRATILNVTARVFARLPTLSAALAVTR